MRPKRALCAKCGEERDFTQFPVMGRCQGFRSRKVCGQCWRGAMSAYNNASFLNKAAAKADWDLLEGPMTIEQVTAWKRPVAPRKQESTPTKTGD